MLGFPLQIDSEELCRTQWDGEKDKGNKCSYVVVISLTPDESGTASKFPIAKDVFGNSVQVAVGVHLNSMMKSFHLLGYIWEYIVRRFYPAPLRRGETWGALFMHPQLTLVAFTDIPAVFFLVH